MESILAYQHNTAATVTTSDRNINTTTGTTGSITTITDGSNGAPPRSSSSSSSLPQQSQFRSVLPHEPPPSSPSSSSTISSSTHNKEYGYLHIQGALTPKFVTIQQNSHHPPSDQENEMVEHHGTSGIDNDKPLVISDTTQNTITATAAITTTTTSSSTTFPNEDFWLEHRTTYEFLLLLQFRAFHQQYRSNGKSESETSTRDNNDTEPQSLQLLYAVPPYTKIRLQYRTIHAAQMALYYYRKHSITTRRLLSLLPTTPTTNGTIINPDTIANHDTNLFDENVLKLYNSATKLRSQLLSSSISVSSSSSSSSDSTLAAPSQLLSDVDITTTFQIVIPDRLLQITEITNRPFLQLRLHRPTIVHSHDNINSHSNHHETTTTSIDADKAKLEAMCWTRSNPPKFRRLIARPYEDEQYIEQQRQSTRFIVVTNLLPPIPAVLSKTTDAVVEAMQSAGHQPDDHNLTKPSKVNIQQHQQQLSIHDMWEQDPVSIAYAIRSVFNPYDTSGYGIEVFVPNQINKRTRHCHIGMRSSHDAQCVIQSLQETIVQWSWIGYENNLMNGNVVEIHKDTVPTITSGKLFIDYAAITQRSMSSSKVDATTISSSTTTTTVTSSLMEGMDPSALLLGHPSRPQCTSTTDDIHIPGLILVPDFISVTEEEVLMAILTGPQAPWTPSQKTASYADGTVRRMVQHYGYVFDYHTANVLRDRSQATTGSPANCPPMPAIISSNENGTVTSMDDSHLESYIAKCIHEGRGWEVLAGIIERTRRYPFVDVHDKNNNNDKQQQQRITATTSFPYLNQLTVNHYKPGEGIGSHVDTPSAFADGLISISLNSGIVMEFRNVQDPKHCKKLVYLPPRSVLLMSKDARYEWEHMIVTRMTDTHNGVVLPRKVRVSLTLRTALAEDGTSYLPLVESHSYPPVWKALPPSSSESSLATTTNTTATASTNALATPSCERDHVHKVYDAIATQWHHTRGKRGVLWPGATQFLQRLSPGSIVADVGCGDGKYFPAIWEAGSYVIGSDISEPLLRTAMHDSSSDEVIPENCRVSDHRQHLRNHPAIIVADCMSVPLRSNSCDAAICIAVLHHLSTLARRKRCIEELVRIVQPGGMVNVQAWALEQEDGSRRKFASNDVFVPFNAQPKYLKWNGSTINRTTSGSESGNAGIADIKSTARMYSEALNAEYDEGKGLVVFQRYCHLYRLGELEEVVAGVPGATLVDSGFESGNYFVIFQVQK